MGKRIIEELATDTIQDNDFILMDNNTTPTDPDDDTAGTRKMRAKEFGAQIITVDDELSTSSENPVQNKVITDAINDLASATEITGTASGSIASFDDGSEMPLKTLQVSIEPVQSGSGEPYPPNGGANKWDEVWADNITIGSYGGNFGSANYVPVTPEATYYIVTGSYNVASSGIRIAYYDENKDLISSSVSYSRTLTIPSGCNFIKFGLQRAIYGTTYKNDIAINYPSSVTTYAPYSNICPISGWDGANVWVQAEVDPTAEADYSISWQTQSGTVYGGNFKLFKDGGKWYCTVTKTYGIRKFSDMPTNRWNKLSSGTGAFYMSKTYSFPDITTEGTSQEITNAMLSDTYKTLPSGTMTEATFRVSDALYVVDSRYESITDFINAISSNDASFIYPLATPTTTTFEIDTEIATLLGVNNVSVDTGSVLACEYVKDTDIVIKKLLYKDLTATLSANATSLTITDSAITTDATYDIFTDTYGVSPTAVSVSNGSMTLTFTARGSATKVKVRVML